MSTQDEDEILLDRDAVHIAGTSLDRRRVAETMAMVQDNPEMKRYADRQKRNPRIIAHVNSMSKSEKDRLRRNMENHTNTRLTEGQKCVLVTTTKEKCIFFPENLEDFEKQELTEFVGFYCSSRGGRKNKVASKIAGRDLHGEVYFVSNKGKDFTMEDFCKL